MNFNKLGGRKFFLCLFGFIVVTLVFVFVGKFTSNDYFLSAVGILGLYFGTNVFQRNSENRYNCNKPYMGGHNDPERHNEDGYSEKG